jgi:hypothetical protein
MEVGDLPGRKCQSDQAITDLFRKYRGSQAGGKRCPSGAVEQALHLIALVPGADLPNEIEADPTRRLGASPGTCPRTQTCAAGIFPTLANQAASARKRGRRTASSAATLTLSRLPVVSQFAADQRFFHLVARPYARSPLASWRLQLRLWPSRLSSRARRRRGPCPSSSGGGTSSVICPVAILMTRTALPMTSRGRRSPLV